MALVMHAYLICGDVGEVHLIFSAILAAGFLAVDPCCVPPSCAEMCGTAQKKKKKVKRTTSTWETSKGTTPVLHPIEQSHTCLLLDLEHDERVVLERGRVPPTAQVAPLGQPLLVAVREKRCGHKERARYRRTRSSRKTWVPASRSVMSVTCGTRNTPCTDIPLSTEETFLSGSALRGTIRAARVASKRVARAARAERKQHTHHAQNAQNAQHAVLEADLEADFRHAQNA